MRHTAAVMPDIQIEPADDPASCRYAEDIQRAVWGGGERSVVPAEQIRAIVHNGGMLLLAREGDEVVGFCYAFVGIEGERPVWCSHMLGVRPAWRSLGVGQALKLAQRDLARTRGIDLITWTFDPLQARNAYINLRRLGAYTRRYFVNHYGEMDDDINRGMPTDRLLAEWPVAKDTQMAVSRPGLDAGAWVLDVVDSADDLPAPGAVASDVEPDGGLIAVPSDIERMRTQDLDLLDAWRHAVRSAFQAAFAVGLVAVDLRRDVRPGVSAYVLAPLEQLT